MGLDKELRQEVSDEGVLIFIIQEDINNQQIGLLLLSLIPNYSRM